VTGPGAHPAVGACPPPAAVRAVGLAGATLAASVAGTAAALACSPAFRTASVVPQQGPGCTYAVDLDAAANVSLGQTHATPSGLILQPLGRGNGCHSSTDLVVHDCRARQVMIIGTEHFVLMEDFDRDPLDRPRLEVIHDAAMSGELATLADFDAASRAQGFGAPLVLRPEQSLDFQGRRVPLSCACREAGLN
jgi:hypothetical protein